MPKLFFRVPECWGPFQSVPYGPWCTSGQSTVRLAMSAILLFFSRLAYASIHFTQQRLTWKFGKNQYRKTILFLQSYRRLRKPDIKPRGSSHYDANWPSCFSGRTFFSGWTSVRGKMGTNSVIIYKIYLFIHLASLMQKLHVAIRLFINWSQMTSNCGKNTKVHTRR